MFLFLSDKGYKDLKKAIVACTITNLALMLPFCVTVMLFNELLNPYVGKQIAWNHIWLLWGIGVVSAVLVFLAARNDYRKTYIASYQESNKTRLNIAEHLRKLPMSFFNTKDLSELTTNMMSDCSSMESMLSSTIPPLIANGITVTLVTERMRTLLSTSVMQGNDKEIENCDIELEHVTFRYNTKDVIKALWKNYEK